MLPILSGVVLRGQVGGWRGFNLSLAYVLPMAACFALLGRTMGLFGAQLNLQARLQSAWVLVPFAMFFALFALAMFGVFELKLPHAISSRLDRIAGRTEGGSLWGAAVLGVVSSLLVSPCVSAPLAGALLYISASGDALGGGLKLFMLGLGMGAPLLLVATGGAAWLPKSGPWLIYVKNAIGVLLLGLAIGLLSRVMPGQITLLLIGLLAGGVGLFMGALEFVYKPPRKRLGQLLGMFLLFYALACWYGAFSGQTDPFNPIGQPRTVAGNEPSAQHQRLANRQHPGRPRPRARRSPGVRHPAAARLVRRLVHQLQSHRTRSAQRCDRRRTPQGLSADPLRHHRQQRRTTRPARPLQTVRPSGTDVFRQGRRRTCRCAGDRRNQCGGLRRTCRQGE